jgi:hypothetical protein
MKGEYQVRDSLSLEKLFKPKPDYKAGKLEVTMRRQAILFVAVIFLTSCIAMAAPKSVGEVKEGLTCLEYKEGMGWLPIAEKFGDPDIAPRPEPGDLSRNARIYQKITVIFYTKRQQVEEGDRLRFVEVVEKVEFCKPK